MVPDARRLGPKECLWHFEDPATQQMVPSRPKAEVHPICLGSRAYEYENAGEVDPRLEVLSFPLPAGYQSAKTEEPDEEPLDQPASTISPKWTTILSPL